MQEPRKMIRPFGYIQGKLHERWRKLSERVKTNLIVQELPKEGNYKVDCQIKNAHGEVLAAGRYNSSSGTHAEIGALANCAPVHNATLYVNPPPCKRCAVILDFFRKKYGWTIVSVGNTFASTYQGAYCLPNYFLDDIVIADLIKKGIINEAEAERHKESIRADFLAGRW